PAARAGPGGVGGGVVGMTIKNDGRRTPPPRGPTSASPSIGQEEPTTQQERPASEQDSVATKSWLDVPGSRPAAAFGATGDAVTGDEDDDLRTMMTDREGTDPSRRIDAGPLVGDGDDLDEVGEAPATVYLEAEPPDDDLGPLPGAAGSAALPAFDLDAPEDVT